MDLQFQIYGKIARPVPEVFDAVYNLSKLSGHFTTGGASAPLDEGLQCLEGRPLVPTRP